MRSFTVKDNHIGTVVSEILRDRHTGPHIILEIQSPSKFASSKDLSEKNLSSMILSLYVSSGRQEYERKEGREINHSMSSETQFQHNNI